MTQITILHIVFFIILFWIFHTYVFYFLTLKFFILFCRIKKDQPDLKDNYVGWPNATLLIPAHNEEKIIHQKIENSLAIDYPADKFVICVCSDCSSDRTVEIAQSYERIKVFDYKERSGKTGMINKTVPQLTTEIVMITDADTMIRPDALFLIMRHFNDPKVGGVSGKIEILSDTLTRNESFYRDYESKLKIMESRLHSTIGANGGMNAFRRNLFEPMPPATIIDDMVIPMNIIKKGYRYLFEQDAIGTEYSLTQSEEFRRRIRIGTGNFQTITFVPEMLLHKYGWVAYGFWSHKIFRWFTPFFMLICFFITISGALKGDHFFIYMLIAQAILLCMFILGYGFNRLKVNHTIVKPFAFVYGFFSMNAALFIGFFKFLKGIKSAAWQPTKRT